MRSLLIVPSLVFIVSAIAQPKTDKASVDWGPEMNEKETGEFGRLFGQEGDAVYLTMYKKKEMMVQRVNGELRTQYSKLLELELEKKDLGLEELMVLGDRIMVFASIYSKKEDERTLYLRSFDIASMAPQGSWRSIARLHSDHERQGSYGVVVSPNAQHILVHMLMPFEKDEPEKFKLLVFDADMNPEWDRDITMPYNDKEFTFEEFRVDSKGEVVMIGVKYAEKHEAKALKRAHKAHYDYHLITYSSDGDIQDHTIEAGGKFLQDLTLSLDSAGGAILCGGFFGNKGQNQVRGSFFLSLDPRTKQVIHESYKEFSDDFITQYMTAKQEEKARKKAEKKDEDMQLYEYDLADIVRRDDGGAVLIGEQYYMYVVTSTSSGPQGQTYTTTTYHYLYNDIIVVNIDPDGNIAWASTIPKRQHSVNDGGFFSSYALEVKGDNLYFVYNDNGENLFLAAGDKFKNTDFNGKGSIVTLANVNSDGRVVREALLDPEKRDLILRPKSCRQLQDDRMFIYATRKNDYRFGTVTFD